MAGDHVVVGRIVRAHGVRGSVVVRPLTDDPATRFAVGSRLIRDGGDDLVVAAVSDHPNGLVVSFVGVADRDAAELLGGTSLAIDRSERLLLGEGEYWPDELIGCSVVDRGGVAVGTLIGYEFGAAQDRLVVRRADGAVAEVPFVEALVPDVDPAAGIVVVDLPEGLFDQA